MNKLVVAIALAGALACSPPAAQASEPKGIGYAGIGDLRIGMSLWHLLETLQQSVTVESVEGDCTNLYSTESPDLVYMVVAGNLARIEVLTPDLATLSGVSVGDSEDDVFAAYPGRVEVSEHQYQEGHYLTVYSSDRESALVFDTDGTRIRLYRIGRVPEALHIEGCS